MMQTWRIDSLGQTLILAGNADALATITYWGASLPPDTCPDTIARAGTIDITGGMLDETPPLSICPEVRRGFAGQAGLVMRQHNGAGYHPQFIFDRAEQTHTKTTTRLTLFYTDKTAGLTYCAIFQSNPNSAVIIAQATLASATPIYLDWLTAPAIPAPQHCPHIIDYGGRWCGEFQEIHTQWQAGARTRDNRTGRSGHEHFPALILAEHADAQNGCAVRSGDVYGFHYGWSGGHRMVAEELADGRRQIQFGTAWGSETLAKTSFETAPLYLSYATGLNGIARAFGRHVRDEIITLPNPKKPRPVHYNCWESVYFNHNITELKTIATKAAALGAERFVLDDGWFNGRDDDTTSLGDWQVDRRKYPDGLSPLIAHIHEQGMEFGLWVEPEMINPQSQTYKTHPDWVLGATDQTLGRGQLVLNMAMSEVGDYIFNAISALLTEYPIDYIKWDHNRVLPYADAAQTRATYVLLDRLRAKHPKVEIETCASGGGRADYGILARTHRVWLSDSNDALERARIQRAAATFLPASVMGSHVGPAQCHTSGRILSLSFRAWVATQGHFGFEMDPRELTAPDTEKLREITQWWKDNRDWLMDADVLRITSADTAVLAGLHLSRDASRFALFVNKIATSAQISPRPLRLEGLDATKDYTISWVNAAECPTLSRGAPLMKDGVARLNGGYLLNHGLVLPWQMPCSTYVFTGVIGG